MPPLRGSRRGGRVRRHHHLPTWEGKNMSCQRKHSFTGVLKGLAPFHSHYSLLPGIVKISASLFHSAVAVAPGLFCDKFPLALGRTEVAHLCSGMGCRNKVT